MPICHYIGADCEHAANALKCKTVPAVKCHERRERLRQAAQEKKESTQSTTSTPSTGEQP